MGEIGTVVVKKPLLSLDKIKDAFESIVDRSGKLVDIATHAGVAYVGYNALKHPMGAVVGLLALRLAQSPNLASGAAGVAALTGLGALNLIPPTEPPPGAGIPIELLLERLRAIGWEPSIPISETPELQQRIRITNDMYLEP